MYVLNNYSQYIILLHTGPSHCVIHNVDIIDLTNVFITDTSSVVETLYRPKISTQT